MRIGNLPVGDGAPLVLISGLNVIENEAEEEKTYCFQCDYCNPACTVKYNSDANEEPQMPEACPFGPSVTDWKRID